MVPADVSCHGSCHGTCHVTCYVTGRHRCAPLGRDMGWEIDETDTSVTDTGVTDDSRVADMGGVPDTGGSFGAVEEEHVERSRPTATRAAPAQPLTAVEM